MSPVRQRTPTVSVPYLIRPKLGSNTVSTDSGSYILFRVPIAQGKQGKEGKKSVREKTGNFKILLKHREFCLLKL